MHAGPRLPSGVGVELPLEFRPPRRRATVDVSVRVVPVVRVVAATQNEQGAHREGEDAGDKSPLAAQIRRRLVEAERDHEWERHCNKRPAEPLSSRLRVEPRARGDNPDPREERHPEGDVDEKDGSSGHEPKDLTSYCTVLPRFWPCHGAAD